MDQDKNQAYLLLARKWKHGKHITWAQLAQVVSNLLLIRIQHAGTMANMWRIIVVGFDRKGCMLEVDLHCRMMDNCVSKMDDIQHTLMTWPSGMNS